MPVTNSIPRTIARLLLTIALIALAPAAVRADLPAGGARPDARIGRGSGETLPFEPAPAAPGAAVVCPDGGIALPNITLSETSDWAIFIATVSAPRASGVVFSIGAKTDKPFAQPGHLQLTWCGGSAAENPWSPALFSRTFTVVGRDDAGTAVSKRRVYGSFLGTRDISPLVSHQAFGDGGSHGLIIQRRGGVVELWAVDAAGPRLMDASQAGGSFAGIADQPARLGAGLVASSRPDDHWKQPIQALLIYNGGALTPLQMQQLYNSADASRLLDLSPQRDDRYYPGIVEAGQLQEVVSGRHGTPAGAGESLSSAAAILPTAVDDVTVDLDGLGQVLPMDPAPATSTTARFWGMRIGPSTDIRMRIVHHGRGTEAHPQTDGTIVVDWTTVATDVGHGQQWAGEVAGIPHGFADYACEVSWKDAAGQWTAPKRINRRWSLGAVVTIAGQSIVQEARSLGGASRTNFPPPLRGFVRAWYDIAQDAAYNQDHSQVQGWVTRPDSTNQQWGENRMAARLGELVEAPLGISNCAVSGSPVRPFLGEDKERWTRWKRFIQRSRPQVIIWANGHGDQVGREVRFKQLDGLLEQIDRAVREAPGGAWNYQFYVFPVNGNTRQSNLDSIRAHDLAWAESRAAAGKPVGVLCEVLEGKTKDGVHLDPSEDGHGLLASRMAQTIAYALGKAPFDGRGPRIDRATATWSTDGAATIIDLPVIANGGTALLTGAGGPPSGFGVKIDGKAVRDVTAAIVNPTLIRLTAPVVAVESVEVTYQAGRPGWAFGKDSESAAAISREQTGTANALYDDRRDPATPSVPGFPMPPIPSADPLTVRKAD